MKKILAQACDFFEQEKSKIVLLLGGSRADFNMQGEAKRHKSVISMQDDDVQLFGEEEEGNSKLVAFGKKWRVRQPGTTSFMGIARAKEIYAIMLVEGDDQVIVNLLDR